MGILAKGARTTTEKDTIIDAKSWGKKKRKKCISCGKKTKSYSYAGAKLCTRCGNLHEW